MREAEPIVPRSVKLEFGSFQQVEDLSGRLETEVNRWCLDMSYNYRHNPDFSTTYREAYKILKSAKFIHSAEHAQDREAIRAEVATIDPLFHHVQDKIKSWTRQERRLVGQGGINGKAEVVESILHHLAYDVGVEAEHSGTAEELAPAPVEEDASIAAPE